jgi:hypothetical protein
MIKMKIVENKILPFGHYTAMTLGKFIFTKDASKITEKVQRHEAIHYCQQAELAYIIFFIMYFLSFVTQFIRCAFIKNLGRVENGNNSLWSRSYRTVLFEREAYLHEDEPEYLENRIPYCWFLLNFYI